MPEQPADRAQQSQRYSKSPVDPEIRRDLHSVRIAVRFTLGSNEEIGAEDSLL